MAPETGAGQERFVTAGFEALVIPDAGHFVHLERPERVAAAIGELLS
jgi:pimeloyl-ACP methyl ester carboxylesterase